MAKKSTVSRASKKKPAAKRTAAKPRTNTNAVTFTPPTRGRFGWNSSCPIPAFEPFGTPALRRAAKGITKRPPKHFAVEIHATPKGAIADECKRSMAAFEADADNTCKAVLAAVLKHYKRVRSSMRSLVSRQELAAAAPVARSVKDLAPLVAFSTLHIHPADAAGSDLGFHFECTWEEEHGLGVRVRNGRVVLVGDEQEASGLWAHAQHTIKEMGDGLGG